MLKSIITLLFVVGLSSVSYSQTPVAKTEPSTTQDVSVEPAVLQSYVGKYELVPGFILTVARYDGQLKVQATGQQEFPVFPKSKNVFYYKVVEAQLTFNSSKEGKVESVTLKQNGQELTGKKVE